MSGIPVDLLVDIDGSNNSFLQSVNVKGFDDDVFDDDPFELCSRQQNTVEKDLGFELGLALEKSLKLHSQASDTQAQFTNVAEPSQTNLGILINLDESPDKKPSISKQVIPSANAAAKDADSVFDSPANPFQLAWDVIQQEALNLANQIQEKDKPYSPRKMVDLAMKLSPDSLLLSPCRNKKEEEILINSSPELEMKKTPKTSRPPQSRGRTSIGGSPLVARNYATPLRNQSRLSINPGSASKISRLVPQSPSMKTATQRTAPVKPPLLRSSSAMAPVSRPLLSKTLSAKVAPVKAAHPANAQLTSKPSVPARSAIQSATPLRRPASTSGTPAEVRLPALNLASKLRSTSCRTEQEALQQPPNKLFERNIPSRLSKRTPAVNQLAANNSLAAGKTQPSTRSNITASLRGRARGRESIAP